MTDVLPRDDESARRLAALRADLREQVTAQLDAYEARYGTRPRLVDNVSRSTGDPFAAPAYYVRSRRHQGNSRRDHNED